MDTLPDVQQLLQQLQASGIPMALATSSRKQKMELVMHTAGLYQYFSAFVTGEEVAAGKPDPQIFLRAAERLGIPRNIVWWWRTPSAESVLRRLQGWLA